MIASTISILILAIEQQVIKQRRLGTYREAVVTEDPERTLSSKAHQGRSIFGGTTIQGGWVLSDPVLSGHRYFHSFLHRTEEEESPKCIFCPDV